MTDTTQSAQPVIFLPHGGGPCFFMEWDPPHTWDTLAEYLRSIPDSLPEKPKAILLISAHWEEDDFTILTKPHPDLLFDYYGFPPHTYELTYDVQNPEWLVQRVITLTKQNNLVVEQDSKRGYDHGVFIPLKVAFPDGDIPVAQLSLKTTLDPQQHIALGKILAPLRKEGVLIIGSGMSYHNLRRMMTNRTNNTDPASIEFDQWLTRSVCLDNSEQRNRLLEEWKFAPRAKEAHPREEHLIPLMVCSGAALESKGKLVFNQSIMQSQISAFHFD